MGETMRFREEIEIAIGVVMLAVGLVGLTLVHGEPESVETAAAGELQVEEMVSAKTEVEAGVETTETTEEEMEEEAATQAIEQKRLEQLSEQGWKLVALTFDDGPSPTTTPRLLDVLKEKGVKATFFVVGTMAERATELLKREKAEGHEIGSHTVGHGNLTKMSAGEIAADMGRMNEVLQGALGEGVKILRPPYGAFTEATKQVVGVPMVYWTVDTMDWKYREAGAVRTEAVKAVFDGAIILMHDIYATSVDAVAGIIDELRGRGYEFVTVSELAAARGITLEKGVVYGSFRP